RRCDTTNHFERDKDSEQRRRHREAKRFSSLRLITSSNRVACTTGAGAAVAFAKEGASVVASGRREAEGKALEAELRSLGTEAAFIRADVRHDDECGSWSTRLLHASAALTPPSTPRGAAGVYTL